MIFVVNLRLVHLNKQANNLRCYHQPQTEQETFDAFRALVTCPTASIGGPHTPVAAIAANHFPEPIEDQVYFCGYAAESSFGAASYLIVRPEGNVLVDSPRFAKPLVKRIEELGGIRYIFLTHIDDIADHDLWAKHFKAERIMHKGDAGRLRTRIERLIEDQDPVQIGERFNDHSNTRAYQRSYGVVV